MLVRHFEMERLSCNILDHLGGSDIITTTLKRERRWENLRRKCAHRVRGQSQTGSKDSGTRMVSESWKGKETNSFLELLPIHVGCPTLRTEDEK